ncbi:hypothetical protein FKM82_025669, partial [Ascaphus truei]
CLSVEETTTFLTAVTPPLLQVALKCHTRKCLSIPPSPCDSCWSSGHRGDMARKVMYPLYQLGNPQLRIFRTNFNMTLVRPGKEQPPDTVQFRISME